MRTDATTSFDVDDATAAKATPVLRGHQLEVAYGPERGNRHRLVALTDVSLTLWPARTLGIVGESGAGKSSLVRALLCLAPEARGDVYWHDVHVSALPEARRRPLRKHVQLIGQDARASLDPRMRIGRCVEELLGVHAPELDRAARRQRVAEVLAQVGLDASIANRLPFELSGGQAQRAAIARALAVRPSVLVCDEPVSALDVSVQAQVLNLLLRLRDELGLALLFISHNLAVIRHVADEVMILYRGRTVEYGGATALFTRPLHPYTRALLAAARRQPVPAQQPRPMAHERTTNGCIYAAACPHADGLCESQRPELLPAEDHAAHRSACHHSASIATTAIWR